MLERNNVIAVRAKVLTRALATVFAASPCPQPHALPVCIGDTAIALQGFEALASARHHRSSPASGQDWASSGVSVLAGCVKQVVGVGFGLRRV